MATSKNSGKAKVNKKVAPGKKSVAKNTPKKSVKSISKSAKTKDSKKSAKKTPVKKIAAKKVPAKKAPAKKVVAKKPAKPVKPVKPPKPPKPAKPVKPAKPEKPAKAQKIVAPVTPPVQVINPIGGTVIPKVRKAVPGKKAEPTRLVAQEDESKWLKSELSLIRKRLLKDVAELEAEISAEEARFHSLIVESGEGAGDDQADAGAKTFEREQEISLLSNKKDLLDQSNHALERIAAGTYGYCENCGKHIGKLRLLDANPRATLCMPCREREDRS